VHFIVINVREQNKLMRGFNIALLNYTTEIKVDKTLIEIEKMLVDAGAQRILKEYDTDGNITTLSFMIQTDKGLIPIRMPMNVKAVMQVINTQTDEYTKSRSGSRLKVPKRYYNDWEQARRVGWRIIKDWLESQLALIQLQMVKIQEIFLPYIIGIDGKTVYENIESQGFKGYLLEHKRDDN